MLKKGFKRLFRWHKKNRNQERSHRLSDHRIVTTALRMCRELAHTRPRLAGSHQEQAQNPKKAEVSAAEHQAEIEAELDRVFEGRSRPRQRGGVRIVLLTCPGGNG